MNTDVVWNPLFNGEIQARVSQQLNTYYKSENVALITKEFPSLQDQPLHQCFGLINQKITANHREKPVSPEIQKRLTLANEAIGFAKSQIPFGAGNQLEAVIATRGNASRRMAQGKSSAYFGQKEKEQMKAGPASTTDSVSLIAHLTQGASCRAYAALTYTYLQRQGIPQEQLTIQSISAGDHVLILLGNPDTSDCIAVDAWPTHAQALLWEDHFAFSKGTKKGTLIPGTSNPLANISIDDLASKLIATEDQPNYNILQYAPCGSVDLSRITYRAGEAWPPIQSDPLPTLRNLQEEKADLQNRMTQI